MYYLISKNKLFLDFMIQAPCYTTEKKLMKLQLIVSQKRRLKIEISFRSFNEQTLTNDYIKYFRIGDAHFFCRRLSSLFPTSTRMKIVY